MFDLYIIYTIDNHHYTAYFCHNKNYEYKYILIKFINAFLQWK